MIKEKTQHILVTISDILLPLVISVSLLVIWRNVTAIVVSMLIILVTARQMLKEKERPSDEREYYSLFAAGYFGWFCAFVSVFILAAWEYAHAGSVGFWFKPMVIGAGLPFFIFNLLFKARIWG